MDKDYDWDSDFDDNELDDWDYKPIKHKSAHSKGEENQTTLPVARKEQSRIIQNKKSCNSSGNQISHRSCPQCGEDVGNAKFCSNCGMQIPEYIHKGRKQSRNASTTSNAERDYNGKISPVSIAAIIFSFFSCLGIIGVILGLIDLSKKDGRKRGLSIAAIVVGIVMTMATFMSIGNNANNKATAENIDNEIEEIKEIEPNIEDQSEENEELPTNIETAELNQVNVEAAPSGEEISDTEDSALENKEATESEIKDQDGSHAILEKPKADEIITVDRKTLHNNVKEYVDKWVRIAGALTSAHTDNAGNGTIQYSGSSNASTIICYLMSDVKIDNISENSYVTTVGKVSTKLLGQTMIYNCYIEDTGDNSKALDEEMISSTGNDNSSSNSVIDSLFGTGEIDKSTAIKLTAEQAFQEYEDNQVACKNNYNGKLIEMTGVIENIGTNVYGQEYVTFYTGNEFSIHGIQCFFRNDQMDYLSTLSKDAQITIYGYADIGSMSFKLGECQP